MKSDFNRVGMQKSKVLKEAIKAIKLDRPDLKYKRVYLASNGNTAMTLCIGNEVFKVGKYNYWEDSIEKETQILPLLAEKKLPVPKLTLIGSELQVLGMTKIRGVTISTVFNEMSSKERAKAARAIARFKIKIENRISAEKLREASPIVQEMRVNGIVFRDNAVKTLKLPGVREILDQYGLYDELMAYLTRVETRKPVVVHGDMHQWNVMVDPVRKEFAGVIDFGSAYVTITPEREFYSMKRHVERGYSEIYNMDFIDKLQSSYARQSRIVTERDIICFDLMHYLDDKSNYSEAPWINPTNKEHEKAMACIENAARKLQKLAEKEKPQQVQKSNGKKLKNGR